MAKKRAFVRYSKQGKIVPGSLILTAGSYPNGPSTWKEVSADLCCDGGPTFTPIQLCYGPDPCVGQCTVGTYYIYQNVIFGIPVVYLLNSEDPGDVASTGGYKIESNGKRMTIGTGGTIIIVQDCA